jgi:NADPH2:quinone reductase
MKAWVVRRWCKPEEMSFEDIAMPQPSKGQALVKIEAAALNFLDTLMIQGMYQVKPPFPFTPGVEFSGTVEAVSEGSNFKKGDRVCGTAENGAFAEYCLADNLGLVSVPDSVPLRLSAAIPVVYSTSHMALKRRADLQRGETLLVHAGAGGVGLAAIQIGKAWGAKVIATAGGPEKVAICLKYGADVAIDYNAEDFVEKVKTLTDGKGADVIYDSVGGDVTDKSLRCIAWDGRLLIVGFASGRIAEIPANRLLLKNAAAIGVFWGGHKRANPAVIKPTLDDVFAMCARGDIKPVIAREYKLSETPQALKDLGSRNTYGKVLVVP